MGDDRRVGGGPVPEALVRGAADADVEGVPALVPAATVVVLRDGANGPEALMVRRNASLAFAGGMWVFPGGRLDPADHPPPANTTASATASESAGPTSENDLLVAARNAAVREAHEETGLLLRPERLVWMSHWTPPARPGRRFATWFFLTALAPDDPAPSEIAVDGGEITDHRWLRPRDALELRDAAEIELSPPTWISLWHLADHPDAAAAVAHVERGEPEHYATRIAVVDDEVIALYTGDAGYESSDAAAVGGRHRLRMREGPWIYERDLDLA